MGLFNKLFGASQPAPPCTIHRDDQDLVRTEDTEWWNKLSLEDCRAFENEDNAIRFAAFSKYFSTDGLSEAEAGKKIRLGFPTFYWNLEQRAEEKFSLGAADAKLPSVLKDRANRAVINGLIDKRTLAKASSFNALVRQLIRSGQI